MIVSLLLMLLKILSEWKVSLIVHLVVLLKIWEVEVSLIVHLLVVLLKI